MLSVRELRAGYGQGQVLHGVSFDVAPGQIVSLLGRNSAGRSTCIKAIMGLVEGRGEILWRGDNILGQKAFQIARRGIGYVPENRDVFPRLSVEQNLLLGIKDRADGAAPRWQLDDMYALFPPLRQRQHTPAGVLSGGEQQMLTLSRTLLGDPDLILIDEPTEGLAPKIVAQVAEFLLELPRRGVGVLLVEQKLGIALQVSARCLVMGHGRIVFDGPPDALRANAAVRREWLEV